MRPIALALALAGCAATTPAPEPKMAAPESAAAVRELPAPTYEQATAWRLPEGVSFEATGPVEVTPERLWVRGVLRNASDREAEVVVFPSGSGGALHAELAPAPGVVDFWRDGEPGRPNLPPRGPPPAPPPPEAFALAPRAEVPFRAPVELGLLKWSGEPEVEVRWTFLFWNEPKPHGSARVRLPRR